jgi:hypothetical protein
MFQVSTPQTFHAMFHEAATRGWNDDELRELAAQWAA